MSMIEIDRIRFTKEEIVLLTHDHTAIQTEYLERVLNFWIKLGVVSEYVFAQYIEIKEKNR